MKDKYLIWSDLNLNYEDWRADLENEYPNMPEGERVALMYEINSDYLSDERTNLNIQLPCGIIVIADLGLWNGRFSGYKMIESGNIRDCLYSDCDCNEWYVDRLGDLRCTAVHHDGRNHYLYRAIKESVTEGQIDRLKSLIYSGRAARQDITRVTKRLGDAIGAVYGWSFPKQKQRESMER